MIKKCIKIIIHLLLISVIVFLFFCNYKMKNTNTYICEELDAANKTIESLFEENETLNIDLNLAQSELNNTTTMLENVKQELENTKLELENTKNEVERLKKDHLYNVDIPNTELEMLACVIYQEAGGDACCDDCRRRVADVVLNRMEDPRFPDTMYDVLTAPRQYGEFYLSGLYWKNRASNPSEQNAVQRAYRIAKEVLNGQHSELYGNGYIWQAGFKQGSDGFWCENCGIYFGK